jgi:hypothetical protein
MLPFVKLQQNGNSIANGGLSLATPYADLKNVLS